MTLERSVAGADATSGEQPAAPAPETGTLPSSAQRVASLLAALGHDRPVVMLPASGRTSAEAAAALGCSVAEIAKSILFRRLADDAPVMVIASGSNRVDEKKVAARFGALGRADARFVKASTGYAIGGVCPLGHPVKPLMLLDADLFRHPLVWAAAGHPHAVFALTPAQLQAMTGAETADIAESVQHPADALPPAAHPAPDQRSMPASAGQPNS